MIKGPDYKHAQEIKRSSRKARELSNTLSHYILKPNVLFMLRPNLSFSTLE